jgi:hypothetical protein
MAPPYAGTVDTCNRFQGRASRQSRKETIMINASYELMKALTADREREIAEIRLWNEVRAARREQARQTRAAQRPSSRDRDPGVWQRLARAFHVHRPATAAGPMGGR